MFSTARGLAPPGLRRQRSTRSRPGPGGAPHYEMQLLIEVPETLDLPALRRALDAEADRLVIDLLLAPA